MINLLRLCRLYYVLPMSFILILTIWYALGDAMATELHGALWATMALAMVISGGYVLNDVCDRRADRVNDPSRPIPADLVKPTVAVIWACCLLLGGLAVATLAQWQFLAMLTIVVVILVFYDVTSKHLGIGKQLLVALLMTSIYPLAFAQAGAGAVSSRVATLYIFPIWLFLTSFGYETLKDIRDIRGDRTVGAELTWVQRHPQLAQRAARVTVLVGAMVLIAPGLAGCGWVYLSIVWLAILLAVVSTFLLPRRAILAIYSECAVVGIAALADIIILGS